MLNYYPTNEEIIEMGKLFIFDDDIFLPFQLKKNQGLISLIFYYDKRKLIIIILYKSILNIIKKAGEINPQLKTIIIKYICTCKFSIWVT